MKKVITLIAFAAFSAVSFAQETKSGVLVVEQLNPDNTSEVVFHPEGGLKMKDYQRYFESIRDQHAFIEKISYDATDNSVHVRCSSNVSLAQVSELLGTFEISKYEYYPDVASTDND
jgi:hypothetical protein